MGGEIMYQIGEFSKITNLTIKALRYYEEENLLIPSTRLQNGYRLYTEKDIKKAELIAFFRDLDFSIKEMKDVFTDDFNEEDIYYFLEEKKVFIEEKMKHQKQMIDQIDRCLLPIDRKEEIQMNESVIEKDCKEIMVMSFRLKGRYDEIGNHIGDLYKEAKGNGESPVFNLYYDEGYALEAEIELCLPLKKPVSSIKYQIRKLPCQKVISVIHHGRYETINTAYKQLIDYAKEHSYELTTPSALIYHKGPGMIFKGNPKNYITEVMIPIVPEKESLL